jgi:internalin A
LLNADSLKVSGAVLRLPELSTLLDKTRYPRHRHDHLMKLMKKFELCFEMPNTQPIRFLIPELLPKETPELPELKAADTLGFEYH